MPDRRGQRTYRRKREITRRPANLQRKDICERALCSWSDSTSLMRGSAPNSVLSQQVCPFMWDPFLFSVFQFKEQQKQTEANPLSSQQPLAGYQLRVIMMSHSSGVSSLMSDIKCDFGLLRPPAIAMQAKQWIMLFTLQRQFHDKKSVTRVSFWFAWMLVCVCVCVQLSLKSAYFVCICTGKSFQCVSS